MDGNSHNTPLRNRRHAPRSKLILRLLADIDVAGDLGSTARVDDVLGDFSVADDGGVLLAWRDGGTIAGECLVDCG
jgi:hypothetical protein